MPKRATQLHETDTKSTVESPRLPRGSDKRKPRRLRHFLKLLSVALLFVVLGGWYAYTHRSQPPSIRKVLFQGVTYMREVRQTPYPLVIHIARVQLDAEGISLLVTPGDAKAKRPLRAQRTSQFLAKHKVQLAINGDFFFPWWSKTPWDYYPHVGDPVELEGIAASRGTLYSRGGERWKFPALYLDQNNVGRFNKIHELKSFYNIIAGIYMILEDGAYVSSRKSYYKSDRQPRTVIALDRTGRQLILCVIDGRQPNYSEGATIEETAQILLKYGAHDALNLDGGGSTTMVMESDNGKPVLLNCPIDNRIPGRERSVANHFGVFAKRLYEMPKP